MKQMILVISILVCLTAFCKPMKSMVGANEISFADGIVPYDSEVEYIEFSGGQWADTGYVPDINNDNWAIVCSFKDMTLNRGCFGCRNRPGTFVGGSFNFWENCNGFPAFDLNDRRSLNNLYEGIDYTLELVGTVLYCNGIVVSTLSNRNSVYSLDNPLFIGNFADGSLVPYKNGFCGKIYEFAIRKKGTLQMYLKPIRIGEEGFFYNAVNGDIIEIYGDGEYIIGPDVE